MIINKKIYFTEKNDEFEYEFSYGTLIFSITYPSGFGTSYYEFDVETIKEMCEDILEKINENS